MHQQKGVKGMPWKDPRPPQWQGVVKGATITIFDMEAYNESLRMYPDDNDKPMTRRIDNVKPSLAKEKPQKRYNWITPLKEPLKGKVS